MVTAVCAHMRYSSNGNMYCATRQCIQAWLFTLEVVIPKPIHCKFLYENTMGLWNVLQNSGRKSTLTWTKDSLTHGPSSLNARPQTCCRHGNMMALVNTYTVV